MDTYIVPVTFPDLDTAKRDAPSLLDALRTAGLHAELEGGAEFESDDDAGRRDPGQTTRRLRVRANSHQEAGERVREVMDGQFSPGMLLLGEPTKA